MAIGRAVSSGAAVICGTILATFICSTSSQAPAAMAHFDGAPSVAGVSGGILLPGTGSVKPLDLAFGVHGSEPKANFGFWLPGLEAGVATAFRNNGDFNDLIEDGKASVKMSVPTETLFKGALASWGGAGGFEESGGRPQVFAVLSYIAPRIALAPSLALEISLGTGTGRFAPLFAGLLLRIHKQAGLLFESAESRSHAGARILLSQKLRLDIFVLDLASPLGNAPVREVFRERVRIGVSTTAAPWRKSGN